MPIRSWHFIPSFLSALFYGKNGALSQKTGQFLYSCSSISNSWLGPTQVPRKFRHLESKPHFPELFQPGFLSDEDFAGAPQILAAKVHLLPDRVDQIPQF